MAAMYQNGQGDPDCLIESPIQIEVAQLLLERASDYGENLRRAIQRSNLVQAHEVICDLFNMCDVLKLSCLYSSLEELRYSLYTCQKSEVVNEKLNSTITCLQRSVRDIRASKNFSIGH